MLLTSTKGPAPAGGNGQAGTAEAIISNQEKKLSSTRFLSRKLSTILVPSS